MSQPAATKSSVLQDDKTMFYKTGIDNVLSLILFPITGKMKM